MKKIIFVILVVILCAITSIIAYNIILNNTKKTIENKVIKGVSNSEYIEYKITNELTIKETNFNDYEKDFKIYANNKEIFKGEPYYVIDKVIKLNNTEFIIEIGETSEGNNIGYYLFYDSGENYINLNEVTKFKLIKKLALNADEFTITSTISSSYVDILCYDYKETKQIELTESFAYMGKGKFNKINEKNERTLLDILKENGYKSCTDAINY